MTKLVIKTKIPQHDSYNIQAGKNHYGVVADSKEDFLIALYNKCVIICAEVNSYHWRKAQLDLDLTNALGIRRGDDRKGQPPLGSDRPRWNPANDAKIAKLEAEKAAYKQFTTSNDIPYMPLDQIFNITTLDAFLKKPGFAIYTLDEWWDASFN
jgi:hypothetical protein